MSFVTQVAGRSVAAVFTTEGVEAGDAEILVLPPQRSERASLASFIKSPNLDEHYTSAVFFFSDDTSNELLNQIGARAVHKAPELAAQLAARFDSLLRNSGEQIDVRRVEALLDNHQPAQGLFYALIGGRNLGTFEAMYDPNEFEPVSVGSQSLVDGESKFQLWTSFRPRHAPPYTEAAPAVSDYHIDTTIHPDLSMSNAAAFSVIAREGDGRVIPLNLSERLRVESATIDGKPAEVFQRNSVERIDWRRGGTFLLVADAPLTPGTVHKIELRYGGSVIRQTSEGTYFVDERNAWFPYRDPTLAQFDLTFRCPARLRLVATGELVSEEVSGDERVVHRKTQVPEALAGFNLGDYKLAPEAGGPYRVECYANSSSAEAMADIPKQTEDVLNYYTEEWMKLPIHSIAVSPVPGYFGQGFPGLIYLSSMSYMREEDRPVAMRNARLDTFFSELLLPHEVAHQWWGNVVTAGNYRAAWILEAMANDSALQFLGHVKGAAAVQAVLDTYREDLTAERNGKTVDGAGPVDFGLRLRDIANNLTWHIITYEKGAWILHMLRRRLGDDGFVKMQMRLFEEFGAKPITNDDLRKVAAEFLPERAPDKTLSLFFDTWIYGTGIPKLTLAGTGPTMTLKVSGVDEDFAADVPLRCSSKDGKDEVRWVRASAGNNDLELPAGSGTCSLPAASEFLYSP